MVKEPFKYLLVKPKHNKYDFRFDAKPKQGYKPEPCRTLTPEQEEELAQIYKNFFVPENQFKVDKGKLEKFRYD